eukprot:5296823-Prymnesium_polylepis.1
MSSVLLASEATKRAAAAMIAEAAATHTAGIAKLLAEKDPKHAAGSCGTADRMPAEMAAEAQVVATMASLRKEMKAELAAAVSEARTVAEQKTAAEAEVALAQLAAELKSVQVAAALGEREASTRATAAAEAHAVSLAKLRAQKDLEMAAALADALQAVHVQLRGGVQNPIMAHTAQPPG